jgi:hypothetical protein
VLLCPSDSQQWEPDVLFRFSRPLIRGWIELGDRPSQGACGVRACSARSDSVVIERDPTVFSLSSILSLLSCSIFSASGRKNPGDWTPLELFVTGVREWENGLLRQLEEGKAEGGLSDSSKVCSPKRRAWGNWPESRTVYDFGCPASLPRRVRRSGGPRLPDRRNLPLALDCHMS